MLSHGGSHVLNGVSSLCPSWPKGTTGQGKYLRMAGAVGIKVNLIVLPKWGK